MAKRATGTRWGSMSDKPRCANCGRAHPKLVPEAGKLYCPGACLMPRRVKTQGEVDALRETRLQGRAR